MQRTNTLADIEQVLLFGWMQEKILYQTKIGT